MASVLEARPGRLLTDRPGLHVELVADVPWIGVAHVSMGSDGPVPPPHVHREHADCFLVLEGGMQVQLDDGERTVKAESWVQVPAGVVHTIAPAGRLRMVNVHAPAAGYAGYIERLARATGPDEIARAREGFDLHDPEGTGNGTGAAALTARLGGAEGETITDRPGRRVTLIGDTTELGVTESVYGPGERGPDPHIHRDHADAFLVLEGALTFTLRDTTLHARAGTLVVVPPLVVHSFGNEGEAPARFVNLHAPSCGFGDYLRGRNPGFDQHEAALDTGGDSASVVVTRLDTGTEGG